MQDKLLKDVLPHCVPFTECTPKVGDLLIYKGWPLTSKIALFSHKIENIRTTQGEYYLYLRRGPNVIGHSFSKFTEKWLIYREKSREKTGFGKFIERIENGN